MNTSNFVFVIQFARPGVNYHATGQNIQEAFERLISKPKRGEPYKLTIFKNGGEDGVLETEIDFQDVEKTKALFESPAKLHSETITL